MITKTSWGAPLPAGSTVLDNGWELAEEPPTAPYLNADNNPADCPAVWRGWLCTREIGHGGVHAAGICVNPDGSGPICAEWVDGDQAFPHAVTA